MWSLGLKVWRPGRPGTTEVALEFERQPGRWKGPEVDPRNTRTTGSRSLGSDGSEEAGKLGGDGGGRLSVGLWRAPDVDDGGGGVCGGLAGSLSGGPGSAS